MPNYRVDVRLSLVVSKAISNSGRMKLGDGPFESVAAVLVVAEHVKAGEAGAEQHVSPGMSGPGCGANRVLEAVAHRVGDAARPESRRTHRTGFADEKGVRHARGDSADEGPQAAPLRLAPGDQPRGGRQAGERRLHSEKIGGLGVVPVCPPV